VSKKGKHNFVPKHTKPIGRGKKKVTQLLPFADFSAGSACANGRDKFETSDALNREFRSENLRTPDRQVQSAT
jgi:hypothetical protein